MTPASKTYVREFGTAMTAYVVMLVGRRYGIASAGS